MRWTKPDCGETTYEGKGRLDGCVALVTGGDSGIGRAAAIAFAREGADVANGIEIATDDSAARWHPACNRERVPWDEKERTMISKHEAVALGRAMGWFSIGLGVVEVLGARPIARWLGVPDHAGKIRGFGLRELKAGWSILRSDVPTPGMLVSRVLGDVMDLAALGAAARADGARPLPIAAATAAVVGATVADVVAAIGLKWGDTAVEQTIEDAVEQAASTARKMAESFPMPTAVGVA